MQIPIHTIIILSQKLTLTNVTNVWDLQVRFFMYTYNRIKNLRRCYHG